MNRIKLTNWNDLANVANGTRAPDTVRSVEVDALVDTGATALMIPEEIATALGLFDAGVRHVKLADGSIHPMRRVKGVQLEILGRDMELEALVGPAGTTTLIGQIPLEGLDLVVDPKNREVRVNPAHPDGPLLDLLAAEAVLTTTADARAVPVTLRSRRLRPMSLL